ncbi:hypothetical protein ACTI_10600 [Actinoplanes sp. OR16]|uniref:hypothetical protein n=1 Tax=Actinoplanes sp. OR16 TaxID=946334 RepID=UPI000F6DEFA1|nr:hypothetical protein [Actinoplanes sp. OR16]BBH64375.1 hypothetical protein ACTI_10600 [Actinoplanes sp. OR16]
MTLPQQSAGRDISPSSADSPADEAAGRGLWGHVLRRCVLVPLIVLTPLLGVAPRGDHRFNIYWHGGMFLDHPLRIVSHTIGTGETYLRLGNFRPLGRMLEKALDTLVLVGAEQLHLSPAIMLRVVTAGAAVLLTLALVIFAESLLTRGPLFGSAPSLVALLLPYAVAGAFVAAGRNSTTTLFGGLYLSTTAVVLLVAAATCRLERLRWWHAVLAVTTGGALAVVNEPAYFAVPLATVAVLVRGWFVTGRRGRDLLRSAGVRLAVLLWAGFLPVFGIVRWIIRGYCADGGCYHGSDIAVDGRSLLIMPARMLAWLPPAQWEAATAKTPGDWLWGVVPLVGLGLIALLGLRTIKALKRVKRPGAGSLTGLAIAAAALLVFGALPAALSVEVHDYFDMRALLTEGWRDSAVTAPAGMLLALAVALLITRRSFVPVLLGVFVMCAAVSATANRAYADASASWASSQLDNRIAQSVGGFERSTAGNARRCALLTEALRELSGEPARQKRLTESLDAAAHALAGVPYCAGGSR